MALFATTLSGLLPLFCLIVLGYGLKRLRVLGLEHVPLMNGLVVNLTLPALVIDKLVNAPTIARATVLPPVLIIVVELAVVGLAVGLARLFRLSRPMSGALMLVSAFGNTGFLGYPIALALLPQQFTAAVLIDQIGMAPLLYVLAPVLGGSHGAARPGDTSAVLGISAAVWRVARSPLFLGLVIGLVIRQIALPPAIASTPAVETLGNVVGQTLSYLGQGTTPLILLSLGVSLRPSAIGNARLAVATAAALKLVVAPILMLILCRLCGVHGDLATIAVLQAAMPAAVMASVLSSTNDLDSDTAVAVVFVTTVLSAVTLPLWATVIR